MKWTPGGRSGNLEDRRSMGGMGAGLGLGGTVVVLALSLIFGRNLFSDLGVEPAVTSGGAPMSAADSAREEPEVQFVSYVLDDVQSTWSTILQKYNTRFTPAKLVLFRNSTQSGCGTAQSAMGPFYCPLDEKVYIDLGFYDELKQRFGAAGDFAQAYVLAHELGHHVQHLLGVDQQVRQQMESNPGAANQLSVRLELQADCFAGVWAATTNQRNMLEAGDAQEAMNAAAAVGDDRIQAQTRGSVNVDSFTHGSSAQRTQWFKRGFDSGDPKACDTFQSGG
ncbi:MAG TPA: neutral zinc metallopeptidase [Gemmatimonadaceae bacterium]|jgi:predicted metalloprotease|nr:neutral zinc metallopeptidase [Gemmatimonadaceae bacterium]